MKNSFRYFENRECKYYPCHNGMEEMNCLFCYCPLYFLPDCPGTREQIEKDGKIIQSCLNCDYPHRPENYGNMMRFLKAAIQNTQKELPERNIGHDDSDSGN